ncbi:CoA-binding protein [Alkalihalobacillus alcalophilus ATCC 27647 = CGMCC 1.3604]|uniref:CoA-binding protein n=1 Tax=Alkalihalobacillus alcalophilus ATCC 27647 = CGMCC 1.3604 TaxID=1218173 RepID=A0A094WL43_ALKAL|nr:CoA-binding protein [Alkalihalobacillus alcalophilus]KGA96658.1 CoA-binding protein [Alkalihalobacillus alcalophilus ATCC 27647 = CGMCC 1.3604]MED1561831.1 CoA-binding protein [Alkalihalobacillus alcalophilus]THG90996.1 CoA-binding protein [Alkalihalobacillus alcalophilus ATCC 27647 = CGMCC 1.3604]
MTFTNPTDQQIKEILHKYKRIAVIGLSNNPARTSYMVSEAMQKAGYEIIPVNPMVDSVLGQKSYASLKDIDKEVDIINVFRRSEFVYDLAKEATEIKPKVFWTQLDVFDEDAAKLLQEHNILTVMNRCIKVEHAKFK